jgi:hypothetical protein
MVKFPSQISPMSQTEQIGLSRCLELFGKQGTDMQAELCIIGLIYRTIGAARGRAARGRPQLV